MGGLLTLATAVRSKGLARLASALPAQAVVDDLVNVNEIVVAPWANVPVIRARVAEYDAQWGRVDVVTLGPDGAGVLHTVNRLIWKINNNAVRVEHTRRYPDGRVEVGHVALSGDNVNAEDYAKIDGVTAVAAVGSDLRVTVGAHAVFPGSGFNHAGAARPVDILIPGVWTPRAAGDASVVVLPAAGGQRFSDVPPGNPFFDFINIGVQMGLAGGHADGTFGWNENVTRGQAMKITVNAIIAVLRLLGRI